MSQAKAPTLFKCAQCGKEYSKQSSFWAHKQTHSDKLHECDQCEKKYKSRGSLLQHKQNAHAEAGRFECGECGKQYTKRSSFQAHMETHSDKLHECDQCEKKYNTRRVLLLHKGTAHAEPGPFECDECGKLCPHKKALLDHKRRVHEAKHRCEYCGKTFGWATMLRRHEATHDEEREKYPCDRCPRTFTSHNGREKHIKLEHSDSRFTCDSECGLHSATRSEYREHLTSRHAKQHPATCKCVSLDAMLAQYIATSMGKTAFIAADGTIKCTSGGCDFTTTCARQMETHKEQCHYDAYQPALRCSSCEVWFSDPHGLKRHNADKHQGERRFKCDDCGYITNDKYSFTLHQTNCQQGKALGNRKLKKAEPSTENLDVKKKSPHAVYQFGSTIGEGGFGTVYKAGKKGEDPPTKYAIKEVGPNGGRSAKTEAKLMRRFDHKNLMALLEYYEWKDGGRLTRFIVMECCLPGSLTNMQKLVKFQFAERHVLYVLKEVTCGLEHLHSAGVIHRDLKSANVLVNERAEVKISDFGVSTDERIASKCQGTRGWMAPEVVDAALTGITGLVSVYTQLADVYSVGVMSIDCFLPRESLPTDFNHKKKVESESFAETQLQRIEEDRNLQLSKAFRDLVTRCLAPMTTRISAAAMRKLPAVKNASVEPFKQLVAECLNSKKEEKRMARKRKASTTDTEASSSLSSTTPRSGPATASAAATRLFSTPSDRPQQPSTSGGMSSLFSPKSPSAHHGQPTASTAATSLFSADDDAPQQPSTSGGMSSLFATGSSRTDHGQLPVSHQTLSPDEY